MFLSSADDIRYRQILPFSGWDYFCVTLYLIKELHHTHQQPHAFLAECASSPQDNENDTSELTSLWFLVHHRLNKKISHASYYSPNVWWTWIHDGCCTKRLVSLSVASVPFSGRQRVHPLDNDPDLHFSPSHCSLAFHHFKQRIINSTQCWGMLLWISVVMGLWSTGNLVKENPLRETFQRTLKLRRAREKNAITKNQAASAKSVSKYLLLLK